MRPAGGTRTVKPCSSALAYSREWPVTVSFRIKFFGDAEPGMLVGRAIAGGDHAVGAAHVSDAWVSRDLPRPAWATWQLRLSSTPGVTQEVQE